MLKIGIPFKQTDDNFVYWLNCNRMCLNCRKLITFAYNIKGLLCHKKNSQNPKNLQMLLLKVF